MIRWLVNEIKLRNFTLNLNEKLYKPIFAERIQPKYFQNSQMVVSMLCNDDKICEKNCLSYFGINISKNLIVSSNFFRLKNPLKFWESCRHFHFHTNCFLFFWKVIEYFAKTETDQKHHGIRSPQSPALLCTGHAYVNRVDIEKVIDEFSSEKVRSKFFSQPIFVPSNVNNLFWIL